MVSTRVTPNAEQMPVNLVGGSVFGRYQKISSEYTQNLFVSTNGAPPDSETFEAWLVNFPGYERILNFTPPPSITPIAYPDDLPSGTGRGLFHSSRGNFALAVVNAGVYRLDANLNETLIGFITSVQGDVYMAENLNQQIAIVDGTNIWIYNYSGIGGLLTMQTPIAGLVPSYVEYHNTFFLVGNSSGPLAYIFEPNVDPTMITQVNPTNSTFAIQTKSDNALAVKRIPGRGNNVLLMGATVCEVWTQVAGGLQPYVRNPSININYGCLSVATIGEGGDLLAWLGANEDEAPVIMVYDGNQAISISTDGIDYLLSTIKAPSSSTAALFRQDGHLFYLLTFYDLRDNLTLLYDFDTKMFFNLTDQAGNYHPLRQVIYFNLGVYFVSIRNTALYQLSSNITAINENLPLTSNTSPFDINLIYDIPRTRITSNIRQANSTRFRANSLVLTLEQGNDENYTEALLQQAIQNAVITELNNNPSYDDILTESGQIVITEQAFNAEYNIINPTINYLFPQTAANNIYIPRIDLSISKTGGLTFGNIVARNLHTLGHRQNILHWEGMGVANDLVLKFSFVGSSRFVISNALLDIIL